jgi:ribosomal protein S21
MPLEIRRYENEDSRSLINRFLRAMRRSGILFEKRRRRFYQKKKSRAAKKKAALVRQRLREKYEKLEKLGKV